MEGRCIPSNWLSLFPALTYPLQPSTPEKKLEELKKAKGKALADDDEDDDDDEEVL